MIYSEMIRTIAGSLTENMPEEKILITPSAGEGRRLLRQLAAAGYFIAGVRAATPRALAREICAGCLPSEVRILECAEAKDLMCRILNDMPEEGFFKGSHAKDRKTGELMYEAVIELEANGIAAIGGNARLDALNAVMNAYKAAKGSAYLDETDTLRFAAEHAKAYFENSTPQFVTLGMYMFGKAEKELIHSVAGEQLKIIPMPIPDECEAPANMIGIPGARVSIDGAALRFVRCRGMETEVRFIMRDIIARGLKAEECTIAFMNAAYKPILCAEADLYHIPITISNGIPMTGCSLYYVLNELSKWKLADYDAEKLRHLILNGGIKLRNSDEFLERLRARNIGWGRERYTGRFLEPEPGDADAPEMIEEWHAFIECILAVADQNGGEEQRVHIRRLLDNYISVADRRDGAALARTRRLLDSIGYLSQDETVLTRLLDLMEDASYLSESDQPGKVFATPMAGSIMTGRKALYICGMSRFCLQGTTAESPIVLDKEKEMYGLPTLADRERENNFRFFMALIAQAEETVLSYCDYDTEKMTELAPAPAYNKLKGDREAEVVSYVPEKPILIGDLAAGNALAGVVMMNAADPDEDTIAAELNKAVDYAQQLERKVYSPTSLETALACPFKFYLSSIMHIASPELPERSGDVWLQANELGTLCHKVLEVYFGEKNDRELREIFDSKLEELHAVRPDTAASAMQKDADRAWEMVNRAVEWTESSGRTIEATEQEFGYRGSGRPMDLQIGGRSVRLCGSIDRVDRLSNGDIAILDYKTGSPKHYRGHEDERLQPYLYTLAYEQMNPGMRITDAGYLFLKDIADFLPVPQTDVSRKQKEKTILALLDWMKDENRAMIAAPAFVTGDQNGIEGIGTAEERTKCLNECSKYCDFRDICIARVQIAEAERLEAETEVLNDD